MTDCYSLAATTSLGELISCAFTMATGSFVLAAIIAFILLLYAMWKFRIPPIAAIPLGLFTVFVFAGAGTPPPMAPIFTTLMWLGIIMLGPIMVLAFWRLHR